VFSKADLLDDEMKDFISKEFKKKYKIKKVFVISSVTQEGIEEIKDYLVDNYSVSLTQEEQEELLKEKNDEIKVYNLKENEDTRNIKVEYV